MRKRIIMSLVVGGLAFSGAFGFSSDARADFQAVDPSVGTALDAAELAFVRHNREHRMWEIQRNMGGRPGPGPGYAPRRGYGPPPAYGPRRGYAPPPAYGPRRGYGPGPGYGPGYRRGYQGTPGWAGRRP